MACNEQLDEDVLAAFALIVEDFAENDELDEEYRRVVVGVDIEGWRRLEGVSFEEHFRMSRCIFQKVIIAVGEHLRSSNRLIRIRTPLDVCLLMTIWVLANGDTHRSVSAQFGKTRSVEFFHYCCLIEALRELAPTYIRWPDAAERNVIRNQFELRYGYVGVIGCIDGTYVDITAPLEQAQRYINRHHNYSLLVQAVADHLLLFRDVYVGEPGSVGDCRMFARSPLSDNLLQRPDQIRPDEHLLGDGAYILSDKVLVPYTDDGHLTPRQRRHNFILSSCRAAVERAFGLLMGKTRRLKFFHNYSLPYAINHIMVSLMLHNFIILEGENPQGQNGNGDIVVEHLADPWEELLAASRQAGALKRKYIARYLYPGDED